MVAVLLPCGAPALPLNDLMADLYSLRSCVSQLSRRAASPNPLDDDGQASWMPSIRRAAAPPKLTPAPLIRPRGHSPAGVPGRAACRADEPASPHRPRRERRRASVGFRRSKVLIASHEAVLGSAIRRPSGRRRCDPRPVGGGSVVRAGQRLHAQAQVFAQRKVERAVTYGADIGQRQERADDRQLAHEVEDDGEEVAAGGEGCAGGRRTVQRLARDGGLGPARQRRRTQRG